MDVVDKLLQKMETQDVMDYELFDLNGKNYCPIDGTISLKEFVDNDNAMNFYSFVKKIKLIKKFVKNHGHRVAIEFEIFLQMPDTNINGPSVECIWVIEISDKQKIIAIDSYWDVDKVKNDLKKNHPDYIKIFSRDKKM